MTEKRPIDANDLMARFFRKECLMQGHSAAASAAYKDAQKTVAAASTVSLWPEWRNPEANPPKVEEDVLILFETACGGYGITTAHYEDGTVLSEKSKFYWEEIFEWGTYDEEHDDYLIPKGWWEYRWSGLRGLQLKQSRPRKENSTLRASTSCWVRILRWRK